MQVLDRWSAQVQDTLNTIERDTAEPTIETQQAAGFITDAEKCKLLLSSLHETTARWVGFGSHGRGGRQGLI